MAKMRGPEPEDWCPPRRGRGTDTEERLREDGAETGGGLEPPGARRGGRGPSVKPPGGSESSLDLRLWPPRWEVTQCSVSKASGHSYGVAGGGRPFGGAELLVPAALRDQIWVHTPPGPAAPAATAGAGGWGRGSARAPASAGMPAGLSGRHEGVRGGLPAAPSSLLRGTATSPRSPSPGQELHPGLPPPGPEGARVETGGRKEKGGVCGAPAARRGGRKGPPFFSEAQTQSLPQGFVLAVRRPCGGPGLGQAGEVLAGWRGVPERPARAGSP